MGRVEGKVAIVTGGASGIGAETARCLASEGARVTLTDVNEALGTAVAKEIGAAATFLAHDVTDEDRWREVIADVQAREGGLHVLVNNAGIVITATVEDTTLEQWRLIQAVNSEGVFLGSSLCLLASTHVREPGAEVGQVLRIGHLRRASDE